MIEIMYDLDAKNRKILYQLDINCRQSNASIGKKVGLSKEVVNYRIKKLENDGIIKWYYTMIDFSKLGYYSIRLYIKLLDASSKIRKEIIEHLVSDTRTFFVVEISGNIDIGVGTWIKNIYEFESFYNNFKKVFKQYIDSEKVSIFVKAYHYHRGYIINKNIDDWPPEIFGGSKEEKHDDVDLNILRIIAKDARIPITKIADKLRIPPPTIIFRIKQMEKKKIIQGYRCVMSHRLLGYNYYKVDLVLKDITGYDKLLAYSHQHPNIVYVDQTIGGSDFEFDIEIQGIGAMESFMIDMQDNFPTIRKWDYFEVKAYKKLLYYPYV